MSPFADGSSFVPFAPKGLVHRRLWQSVRFWKADGVDISSRYGKRSIGNLWFGPQWCMMGVERRWILDLKMLQGLERGQLMTCRCSAAARRLVEGNFECEQVWRCTRRLIYKSLEHPYGVHGRAANPPVDRAILRPKKRRFCKGRAGPYLSLSDL